MFEHLMKIGEEERRRVVRRVVSFKDFACGLHTICFVYKRFCYNKMIKLYSMMSQECFPMCYSKLNAVNKECIPQKVQVNHKVNEFEKY